MMEDVLGWYDRITATLPAPLPVRLLLYSLWDLQ
jgi:hypothetical protein